MAGARSVAQSPQGPNAADPSRSTEALSAAQRVDAGLAFRLGQHETAAWREALAGRARPEAHRQALPSSSAAEGRGARQLAS